MDLVHLIIISIIIIIVIINILGCLSDKHNDCARVEKWENISIGERYNNLFVNLVSLVIR